MFVTNPTLPPKAGFLIVRDEKGNDQYVPINESFIKEILEVIDTI